MFKDVKECGGEGGVKEAPHGCATARAAHPGPASGHVRDPRAQ